MKHLKIFESFNDRDINILCQKWHIKNYKINLDGSINVDADVFFPAGAHIEKIPIKFNRVNGYFGCFHNDLTTLENSPYHVGGFSCSHNKLTTLVGGPQYVGGIYACDTNELKDVYGFPEAYNGLFLSINNNPVCEIIDIIDPCFIVNLEKIKFIYWLNEYHVIRNGNTIIEDRLDEALYSMGIKTRRIDLKKEFKNYKLI